MFYMLAQDSSANELTMLDVLLWPVAMTMLAWVIFYFGWWVEKKKNVKAPWKWLSLAPVAFGIYVGFDYVRQILDPFYQQLVGVGMMKKMVAAHWGALIIPLIGLAGIVLFHFFNHKLDIVIEDD